MTVHRRSIEAGSPTSAPLDAAPDPFGVRLAGRHLYDRATHAYVRLDEPSYLQRLADAYREVYATPAASAARTPADPAEARTALGPEFVQDFAAAVEDAFGIDVIRLEGVDGDFAFATGGRAVIVVGTTANWFFQNWSIAHELGHILHGELDTDSPSPSSRASERAANAFASELLLPAVGVAARDWCEPIETDVADFVWNSGVSTLALASRLRSLKLETSPAVRGMLAVSTSRLVQRGNILRRTPSDLPRRTALSASPRFPPDLLEAHRVAIADGRIASNSLDWMTERLEPIVP
jgi:Zn-dependent peptidase ImmA (M78 family)